MDSTSKTERSGRCDSELCQTDFRFCDKPGQAAGRGRGSGSGDYGAVVEILLRCAGH